MYSGKTCQLQRLSPIPSEFILSLISGHYNYHSPLLLHPHFRYKRAFYYNDIGLLRLARRVKWVGSFTFIKAFIDPYSCSLPDSTTLFVQLVSGTRTKSNPRQRPSPQDGEWLNLGPSRRRMTCRRCPSVCSPWTSAKSCMVSTGRSREASWRVSCVRAVGPGSRTLVRGILGDPFK